MRSPQVKYGLRCLISVCLVIFLIRILDWDSVRQLPPTTVFLIGVGSINSLLVIFFMTLRWFLLMNHNTKQTISLKTTYQGYLIGSFYNMLIPGAIGGDIIRARYCHDKCGITIKRSAMFILIERLSGGAVQFSFLIIGIGIGKFYLLTDQFHFWEILLFFIAATAGLAVFFFLWNKMKLTIEIIIKVFLLSFLAQGADLVISTCFLYFLWPETDFFWLLIAMPLSFFVTILPISLNGLGVRECVMVGVLSLFKVDASQAVIFSLMLYFSKVPVALLGGLIVMLNTQKKTLPPT